MRRILVAVYLLAAWIAGAQEKVINKVAPVGTASLDGKDLFREYCAVCHGKDGKGNGPAAGALKENPSDLTQIARSHNGHFPEDKILSILKGETPVVADGDQEMPVWGRVISNMHSLVQYIQSLQAK